MKLSKVLLILLVAIMGFISCEKEPEIPMPIEEPILLDETPFEFDYGNLPAPTLPADNPLTIQGVHLGKMLFYEPMLSLDNSQSCAGCHNQNNGFSDSTRLSIGVEGLSGKRQAMPIFNMAWHSNEFFWDGRATLLRDQALLPIQDPLEMNETLDNVVAKLSDAKLYRDQFMRTFGSEEITSDKMALAMEQFMMSIVSYDSKYDRYLAGLEQLTESETRGLELFGTEYNPFFPEFSGADCAHCHGGANFENDQFINNGLDIDVNFGDIGREEVTGDSADRAKFKVPSLRNISMTAPYMHDGRFQTLEEVIDHYNEGIQASSTADVTVLNTIETGLFLTDQDKQDLINFLHTLTDETFINNPEYQTPFN